MTNRLNLNAGAVCRQWAISLGYERRMHDVMRCSLVFGSVHDWVFDRY
jgi:hypothetical protein